MDDDNYSGESLALVECLCSIAASVVLLVISAVTLARVFRVLLERDGPARLACRRWALVASAAVVAWFLSPSHVTLDPLIPLVAAVAVMDCWLVLLFCPQPAIPQARARRRTHPS